MFSTRLTRILTPVAGLGATAAVAAAQLQAPAAPVAASPTVMLRYRELTNRDELKLVVGERRVTKAVGDMTMEFPVGTFPAAGLDAAVRTFCVEPLVPMYAGEVYPFAVEPITRPAHYGLPDTPAGGEQADRRARFVRELYGRYYADVAADPKLNAPAFQTALWELTQEREVPDGPMPFSLFTGSFRADYPAEADAPGFVRTAQRYVQTLTGDDAPFAASQALANLELARLTALQPVGGLAAQSQLALRAAPLPDAGPGGGGPALGGGLGGIPTGAGGIGRTGGGLGGPGIGSPGGGAGGFGGIGGFGGVAPTSTTTPADATTPRAGPDTGTTPTVIPTLPIAPGGELGGGNQGPSGPLLPQNPNTGGTSSGGSTGGNTGGSSGGTTGGTTGGTSGGSSGTSGVVEPPVPAPVVPAPAGLVLAAIALVAVGAGRLVRPAA